MGGRLRRKMGLAVALAMLVGVIASPASATRPDPGSDLVSGHKIWICHTTRSLSNPYVKILIDIAAWDVEDPDSNDHGPEHHLREKNGIVWGDYALENPDDECTLDVPPPLCPDGSTADYVVEFPGEEKLVPQSPTQTVYIDIPAGAYDVTLISGDYDRGSGIQENEIWRLRGSTPTGYTGSTGYTDDLDDNVAYISGEATTGLTIVFASGVSAVVAEHYSVLNPGDHSPNSVVPEYACLTKSDPPGNA